MTQHRSARRPVAPARADDWAGWIAYGLAWAALAPPAPATATSGSRRLTFVGYREEVPGPRWQALFRATWPAYRAWYLSQGWSALPTLAEAEAALRTHMPELHDTWLSLASLSGSDPVAARMLTMWRMPLFATGCSQVVRAEPEPLLIRNYDYDPQLFEGVAASTNYSGSRRVLGTSDMLWGLLDGMNDAGLAVSLTYGGRPTGSDAAPGFAIPLVVRYLLETCSDVAEAARTLRRLPVAQSYNVALVDAGGAHASVFVAPGCDAIVSDLAVTTNHRLQTVEHPEVAGPLASRERQRLLQNHLAADSADLVTTFLRAPVRSTDYAGGFGTLYTAQYRPAAGTLTYHWPDATWSRGFEDGEGQIETWVSQGR
ncbi:hypothetical protein KILIM_040_00510 [Kineosphaera limosa NBRC 100340]|uniref:Peptidase C45 hydrolase domain-containing protein n=1 Tax=Kineosphaera limosa NBRC 100340 TaxID=1184609 RepID=K6WWR2_9MICO|nr:hypothetical protein KILIM_040_00510 [Kineosphaera limosa NBRC 100340]